LTDVPAGNQRGRIRILDGPRQADAKSRGEQQPRPAGAIELGSAHRSYCSVAGGAGNMGARL